MTSLSFGTSGLRGLVTDLRGAPAQDWTRAFLRHVEAGGKLATTTLLVGRDLRSSSPDIAADCITAAQSLNWRVLDCAALPTPALALAARNMGAAAIMVTGSHIPDDRNGLKFYMPDEITKTDEAAIRTLHSRLMHETAAKSLNPVESASETALGLYMARYRDFFPPGCLDGMTIGVYQHSTVIRDILVKLLDAFGAKAIPLGRTEIFLPVDTEAHRPEDLERLTGWASESQFQAIVSADGDADRPLLADEAGQVLRGDTLGILTADYLEADTIVTPVTSSSLVETSGVAQRVVRSRVDYPLVIEAMEKATEAYGGTVIGFEANGGVLLGTEVRLPGGLLKPLPTRDAILPLLCVLAAARKGGITVGQLAATVGSNHAMADRLKDVPAFRSGPFLNRLWADEAYVAECLAELGPIRSRDRVDGVRFCLDDGASVHFRASGNAPELRVYVEAETEERARILQGIALRIAKNATVSA